MFFPVIGFVSTLLSTGGAWRLAHGLRVRRGGPFLCPPVPRRVRSSDQGTEPLLGQAGLKYMHNPIVRSSLADGRTQEGSAPTQLHEPCLSDGLLRIVSSRAQNTFLCTRSNPNSGFLKWPGFH